MILRVVAGGMHSDAGSNIARFKNDVVLVKPTIGIHFRQILGKKMSKLNNPTTNFLSGLMHDDGCPLEDRLSPTALASIRVNSRLFNAKA
jgi:hypothetical protein